MAFLGIDVGTSSVKVSIVGEDGVILASATAPASSERAINSPNPNWAEQNPEDWWEDAQQAILNLPLEARLQVEAIGIAYQMHGLVLVDSQFQPVRPSIIWCDGRNIQESQILAESLGLDALENRLLNKPGTLTLAKLAWVAEHEPETLAKAHTFGLPGDFIAYKLTGEWSTTKSGYSEMVGWDFGASIPFEEGFRKAGWKLPLPEARPNLEEGAPIQKVIAEKLGLPPSARVTYRAGDQPNNAFGLGVLQQGETAISAGTSGVLYGIGDSSPGLHEGINRFLHVNSQIGVLMCLNGVGSALAFARRTWFQNQSYEALSELASQANPENCPYFFPFGNGAERILSERAFSGFTELDFNRHNLPELARSVFEGIAFAYRLGSEKMEKAGCLSKVVNGTESGLLKSSFFAQLLANELQVELILSEGDGSTAAARGAALGIKKILPKPAPLKRYLPTSPANHERFSHWHKILEKFLQPAS